MHRLARGMLKRVNSERLLSFHCFLKYCFVFFSRVTVCFVLVFTTDGRKSGQQGPGYIASRTERGMYQTKLRHSKQEKLRPRNEDTLLHLHLWRPRCWPATLQ